MKRKTETLFAPGEVCNRAQAVTFLWRLAGEPTASSSAGFADVPDGAYYAEAVDWAVENGIASGISKTSFGPEKSCKRSDIVTFMYRYEGCPEVEVPETETTQTSKDGAAIAEYRKILNQAPSMGAFSSQLSIHITSTAPNGKYNYALVTLQPGEGPSLLLQQEVNTGSFIRIYYYDEKTGTMYQPSDSVSLAAMESVGLAPDGNGLYYMAWSLTGSGEAVRINRNGNQLTRTTAAEFDLRSGISAPQTKPINWHALSDTSGLDSWS